MATLFHCMAIIDLDKLIRSNGLSKNPPNKKTTWTIWKHNHQRPPQRSALQSYLIQAICHRNDDDGCGANLNLNINGDDDDNGGGANVDGDVNDGRGADVYVCGGNNEGRRRWGRARVRRRTERARRRGAKKEEVSNLSFLSIMILN